MQFAVTITKKAMLNLTYTDIKSRILSGLYSVGYCRKFKLLFGDYIKKKLSKNYEEILSEIHENAIDKIKKVCYN